MKIFIVAWGYPSQKYVGNGIFQFDQAKALVSRGHEVVFAAIDLRSIRRWRHWGCESLKKDGVHIEAVNIPLGRFPYCILHGLGRLGLSKVYKKSLLKYGKPDVIHAHFTDPAYVAIKALSKYGLPIVMTEHSSGINEDIINRRLKKIAIFVYNRVQALIVVSPTLKQRIEDNFKISSMIIPNIVDLRVFKYQGVRQSPESFMIISVGNLIPLKRMDLLIRAFEIFQNSNENSRLIIFGDGPEKKSLNDLIVELDLDGKVELRGRCSRNEIANSLHQASCFVLASESETFGVAYIEALACGVPVIATKCGGPEGFVHEGNGILVPLDDENAIFEAMKRMNANIDTYDRNKIASEIRDKFSPDAVASQLEEVYAKLINTN